MFYDFDIYGCSSVQTMRSSYLKREDFCPGDCCHCYYASICPDCGDGGVQ